MRIYIHIGADFLRQRLYLSGGIYLLLQHKGQEGKNELE